MTCAEMDAPLAGRILGDLDAARSTMLDKHLSECSSCQERLARLEAWRERPEPPASRWDELAARIEADRVRPVRVTLTCSYCHDALDRRAASFCAACLAPHHEECFSEHGDCATPGCGERRIVRATSPAAPPARTSASASESACAVA